MYSLENETYSLPDAEHGGGMAPNRIRMDFSVNVNPFGMPEGVRKILADAAEQGGYYPEITNRLLREKILDHERHHYQGTLSLQISQIVAGNGASELITALAHGGTVMAFMEKFGKPERAYYEWQPGNGEGWELEVETEGLPEDAPVCRVVVKISFLK